MVPGGSEAYVITLIELNVLVGSRDSHISPHRSKGCSESLGPPASAQPEAQPSRERTALVPTPYYANFSRGGSANRGWISKMLRVFEDLLNNRVFFDEALKSFSRKLDKQLVSVRVQRSCL